MQKSPLGTTRLTPSVVGLGTWQLGADWGEVTPTEARAVMSAAVEGGITFFDTADVYGDGRSEQLIGDFLDTHDLRDTVTVATKIGRRSEQVPENYVLENFRQWVDRSRRNLNTDCLQLVQLHCPPSAVYSNAAVYEALDTLVEEGALAHYGVSVETTAEALEAMRHPNVRSVQLIANAFRIKPIDDVLPVAQEAGVGIIVRVPLASGLLSGRYDENSTFAADDHRTYNRAGEFFDVGETFAGVDFRTGVAAAREFRAVVAELAPAGTTPAQAAIAWLWQQPGVSTVIPGARNAQQATANAGAGNVPVLSDAFDAAVRDIYDRHFRAGVHHRW